MTSPPGARARARASGRSGLQPLDARLAVGAGCAWLAVLLLLDAHAASILAAAVAATIGGGLVLVTLTRRWPPTAALSLALFCIALALFPLAGRVSRATASPLVRLAQRHAAVTLDLTVTDDPHLLAAKSPAGAARVAVETSADAVTTGPISLPSGSASAGSGLPGGGSTGSGLPGSRLPGAGSTGPGSTGRVAAEGTVLVLGDAGPWRDTLPGQRVRLTGSLQPDLGGGMLSVTLFERGPPRLLGRAPWYQRMAGTVRSGLRSAAFELPSQERGLLPGLVDGDTANLDPVLAQHFRLAGLTHLVAVSGTNCSIVVGVVLLTLRRMRVRPWICALIGGLVLLMFVLVARPSPSVLRAALMAAVALVSLATGRPRSALPALSAVVIALLLWDPTLATSASFAMSVLATAALLVLAPGWARALRAHGVPLGLAESVAVAAAAHLVTAPIVAALSGQVSLVAVPANVLAEPVVAVTTVLGFAAAVVAPLWLGGGVALAWLAGWPCRWLVGVADFFGALHGAVVPWVGGMAGGLALFGVLALIGVLTIRAGPRKAIAAAAATAVIVLIPVRAATNAWPPDGWTLVACDVGQGDALVLNAGRDAAVLVDAGPDPVLVDRCLRDLGVASLPLVLLTHLHLDHIGGLGGALRGRSIGQVMAGPLPDPASGASIVAHVAGERHRTVHSPVPGTRLQVGAVTIDVLGPAKAYHGTRSDPNNSSLVVRATVHGVRILLPGDAEIEAQSELLASGVDLRADVLKVPHHGSAYSEPGFLAAVHASAAVVSVGLGNDYGHPSPVLLREMAVLGVPLLRTDHEGDVAVVSNNGAMSMVVHGKTASSVGAGGAPLRSVVRLHAPAAPTTPAGPTTEWADARPTGAMSVSAGAVSRPPASPIRGSVADAKMATCQRVRSLSTICPIRYRRCSSSSATRSCSSIAQSARSPPPRPAHTPTWSRPSARAPSWKDPSCTNCSAPRCSAMAG